jgi:hypothetical protein
MAVITIRFGNIRFEQEMGMPSGNEMGVAEIDCGTTVL